MGEAVRERLIDEEEAKLPSSSSLPTTTTAVVVLSTLVAGCGFFSFGCASGYSSPAEHGIRKDLDLSIAAFSVFGSIMTIGGMTGAILSGRMADLLGRRKAMWISQLVCTIGWLAIAFAKDSFWLDIGRLCIGFGIGILTYVVPVYIAEIAPKNLRGLFISTNQLMSTGGFALIFLAGNLISWRTLALISVIPCLIQLIGLFFVPESLRWLVKLDREKEFENALQRLRGKDTDCSEEAAEIKDHWETSQLESESGLLVLFQKKYTNSLIIGVGLMLLQQFGGVSALSYYACTIFEEAGFSSRIGTTIIATIQIPVVFVGVMLMDKAGRRLLLLISAGGLCFSFFLIGFGFCLQTIDDLKKVTPILVLIGFMGASIFNAIGMSGIPWVIMSEIFPLNVKASAGSLVTLVNWSCTWMVTYTFNFMMEWNPAGTFFIFAGVYATMVLFIVRIVPETKGLTLEEIQETITSRTFLK